MSNDGEVKRKGKKGAKAASADDGAKVAPTEETSANTGTASREGTTAATEPEAPKRKLGPKGAAPWVARHAAKHAAEARARAAEPPAPGSARATLRVPTGAEEIKAKIAALHNALVQVRTLRSNLGKNFYDIGVVLREVQAGKLYEAKGFGSFEAFLEREIDLGKTISLQLVRIATVFQKEAALGAGYDRCVAALAALDAPTDTGVVAPPVVRQSTNLPLPLKPPARRTG